MKITWVSRDPEGDTMDLEKALHETFTIWSSLAFSGKKVKPQTAYEHNCPLCEYVKQKNGFSMLCAIRNKKYCIRDCPLTTIWPEGCEGDDSVYTLWSVTDNEAIRKFCASIIAEEARSQLERLCLSQEERIKRS